MPQNDRIHIEKKSNLFRRRTIDLPYVSSTMDMWIQLINCDRTQL